MERNELHELQYITPISNVVSILQHGILSHARARRLPHHSVAMQQIQDRRSQKRVPGGRPLHDYANLYICARNPMLYKRLSQHQSICVLRVDPDVIDLPHVVITDRNAASDYACFAAAPDGLSIVDHAKTFAEDWTHPEQIESWRLKAAKCAEVLVPDRVDTRFIRGACVSCDQSRKVFEELKTDLPVDVDSYLYFLGTDRG
jgi:ssDNA thymidine ADP-ribosyltransferase, DarT